LVGGNKKQETPTPDPTAAGKVNNPNDPNSQAKTDGKTDNKADNKTDNKAEDAKLESRNSGPELTEQQK
jgi:hypothetical protein